QRARDRRVQERVRAASAAPAHRAEEPPWCQQRRDIGPQGATRARRPPHGRLALHRAAPGQRAGEGTGPGGSGARKRSMRGAGAERAKWVFAAGACLVAAAAAAQETAPPAGAAQPPPQTIVAARITCSSKPGERQHCPADTSKGVALTRSSGEAPCLLGKSWGYDDRGVWVSDGCTGEFVVGQELSEAMEKVGAKKKAPAYIPNAGFLLVDGEKGQIYVRLFSYVRYLNQKGLDPSYTDSFGNTFAVKQREDVQLTKFFLPFSGWFLTPKFRYYLYVWSANTGQGDPAQVVGAGNLSYTFNRHVSLGGGITSLPSTRSTEGQFPYWLGVDDRLTSDEFFRGSYTTGFWLKGEVSTKLKYMAMIANNLSTLGVSASQLDNTIDTTSLSLNWLPTTKEFGLYGTFGDFDYHQKVATRLGLHFTASTEDKQS